MVDSVAVAIFRSAGHRGTIEANAFQRTVDYPDDWANGYHVMLDTEKLVTVRWDQVQGIVHVHPKNR